MRGKKFREQVTKIPPNKRAAKPKEFARRSEELNAEPGQYILWDCYSEGKIDPTQWGIYYDGPTSKQLSNYTIRFTRQVRKMDGRKETILFEGKLLVAGREIPFSISAADFANNQKLRTLLSTQGGLAVKTYGQKVGRIRDAIIDGCDVSNLQQVTQVQDFGWDPDKKVFLVRSGQINADGFIPADQAAIRLEVPDPSLAERLDLPQVTGEELNKLKRHIYQDLLKLKDKRVTWPLLGAAGVVGGTGL